MATTDSALFKQFRDHRDRQEFAEHQAAAEAERAEAEAVAEKLRRQLEFINMTVGNDPPSRQQVRAISEALRADVSDALRRHVDALAAFNSRLDEVAGQARVLDLIDDLDAPITWISAGADRGLHLDGRRVDRAVGWRHSATSTLMSAISAVERATR